MLLVKRPKREQTPYGWLFGKKIKPVFLHVIAVLSSHMLQINLKQMYNFSMDRPFGYRIRYGYLGVKMFKLF